MFWLQRFLRVVLRRRDDDAVDAELREHLELETEDLVRRGVPRDEARRQALIAFGGVEGVRVEAREARRVAWLDTLYFDARHAARSLWRQPGFTFVIVVTLAIGVGANASLYALVSGLMFKPPTGVHEPGRLVTVNSADNYIKFLDIDEQAKTLDVAAYNDADLILGSGSDAVELRGECVTHGYFQLLGARPLIGRTFGSDLAGERQDPAVVISHGLWQRQFGGSRNVIGQAVSISERRHTVVGVMPRGFSGVTPNPIDAWILLVVSADKCSFMGRSLLGSSTAGFLDTVGRLDDGVTIEQAEAEVSALATPEERFERMANRIAAAQPEVTPLSKSRSQSVTRDAGLAAWLLGGAVVVLLIACANVAGLLSIRAIDRRRETAVRLQLGASRARLLRLFALEQLMTAVLCASAAIVVIAGLNRVLGVFFPYAVLSNVIGTDVFWLTFGLVAVASALSGIIPAIQTSRGRSTTFAESSRFATPEQSFFRSSLLVVQVAFAFALVVGGGLFTRSVLNTRQNLGYNPDGLYVVAADLRKAGMSNPIDVNDTFEAMRAALKEQAFVQSVGLSDGQFLGVGGPMRVTPSAPGAPGMRITAVSPDYFPATGTRVVRGRAFNDGDTRSSKPVSIVDERLARSLWPGQDPIGRCDIGAAGPRKGQPAPPCREIVGVAEARRMALGSTRVNHELFTPLAQGDAEQVPQLVLVRAKNRSTNDHRAIAAAARKAVPKVPYLSVRSFDDLADAQTRSWRLGQAMFGVFALIGVFLCGLGLYSLLALAARQRTTEIGVRMALGARPADIARLVLRHATTIVGIGWMLGFAASYFAGRSIQAFLFQVQSTDAMTFAAASAVVLLAGAAGCVLPAARAASVSPVEVLRHE